MKGTTTETVSPLRQWRLKHDLTLDDLADLSGLDVSVLSRVERGLRHLPPLERVKLARRVGARVRDIFPLGPSAA